MSNSPSAAVLPTVPDSVRAERIVRAAASRLPRANFRRVTDSMWLSPFSKTGVAIVALVIGPHGVPDTASRTVVHAEGDPSVAWLACQRVFKSMYIPVPTEPEGAVALDHLTIEAGGGPGSMPVISETEKRKMMDRSKDEERTINARLDSMPPAALRQWIAAKPNCNAFRPPSRPASIRGRGR
jgi:hypothetical protein